MGILIVFDLTDEKSFQSTWNTTSLLTHPPTDVRNWYKDVQQHANDGACKILVGNKCDWDEKRVRTTILACVGC